MASDDGLIFGQLALQLRIIDRTGLELALERCKTEPLKGLDQHLLELNLVFPEQHELILALVQLNLRKSAEDSTHLPPAAGDEATDLSLTKDIVSGRVESTRDLFSGSDLWRNLTHPEQNFGVSGNQGRFEVLRPHAEGGLGKVSVARDTELNREVALKEIKSEHADDDSSRARFVLEAEITGGLEHPGIVPVYGLGVRGDGRPYYAMRFIRGDDLKQAIQRLHANGKIPQTLDLRKLLSRFLDICRAINYAHARGVLHRDIKPANVMLGKYGETLVVDWGLAKLVHREGADAGAAGEGMLHPSSASGSEPTEMGIAVGTPAYMSPEQAQGRTDQLSPASDVFSLGVTLYELLTGDRPYHGKNAMEILEKARKREFQSPRRLKSWIPKPLEAICLKAMSYDAASRYQSSEVLASEVEAYLADEPVTAWKEPISVRIRRWIRRHPAVVSTTSSLLILGVLAVAFFAWQQYAHATAMIAKNAQLELQRGRAEDREQLAIDAIKKFGDVVTENVLLKNNSELESLRKTLLDEPIDFFRVLSDRLQSDQETGIDSLSRLADASFELGVLVDEIGDKRNAITAFQESLEIRRKLADAGPSNPAIQNDMAMCLVNIGSLVAETGQLGDAFVFYEEALNHRRSLVAAYPTDVKYQAKLALTHRILGVALRESGRRAEALASLGEARDVLERLTAVNPEDRDSQSELSSTYRELGLLFSESGQTNDAHQVYALSREILERLASSDPDDIEIHNELVFTLNNSGINLEASGRQADALQAYTDAIEVREDMVAKHPTITNFQIDLAKCYRNAGALLMESNESERALEFVGRSRAILARLLAIDTGSAEVQSGLAVTLINLGNLLADADNKKEALAAYEEARDLLVELGSEDPGSIRQQGYLATCHNGIATLLFELDREQEALMAFDEARIVQERLVAENPTDTGLQNSLGLTLFNLGYVGVLMSNYEQARDDLRSAIRIHQRAVSGSPTNPAYREDLETCQRLLLETAKLLEDEELRLEAERGLAGLRVSDPSATEMELRILAILRGEAEESSAELMNLGARAYETMRYALAVKIWGLGFERYPGLAGELDGKRRFIAACAAALAAIGQGIDEPAPTEEVKAQLRSLSLRWLQAELEAWEAASAGDESRRKETQAALKEWQVEPDLANVRDAGIDALPESEREAWRELWTRVSSVVQGD